MIFGQTQIIRIPNTHNKVEWIILQIPIIKFLNLNELIIAPTLTNIKSRTILPPGSFGLIHRPNLNNILEPLLISGGPGHLHKNRQVPALGNPIAPRINLQLPLNPIQKISLRIHYILCYRGVVPQAITKIIVLGKDLR